MSHALEIRSLTKRFGEQTAVDGLDLAVEPGEVFGFLGPNGAGKTTTIRMALGLIRPTAGTTTIFDQDVATARARALRGVGAIVDAPAFYGYLDGATNLRVLSSSSGTAGRAAIPDVLDRVGLGGTGKKKVKAYSRGMQQRLGLALALLSGSRLLVLDEPTVGMDPEGRDEFREIVRGLSGRGITVFLSSHLLGEVETMCDRIALLCSGKLVAQGRLDELLVSGTWRVRVEGGADRLDEARRVAAGVPACSGATVANGTLEVRLAEDARGADLCARLVEAGVRVVEFGPVRPTLEDFFREHTSPGVPS